MLMGAHESLQQMIFQYVLRPCDQVIDVGVNVGRYTVLAWQRYGLMAKFWRSNRSRPC